MNIDELRNNILKYEQGFKVKEEMTKKELIEIINTLYADSYSTLSEFEKLIFENRKLKGLLLNKGN